MQRRATKQRDVVYAALTELYHPTADELFEHLQKKHPGIGRATVFRNLTVLAEEGRVCRLSFVGDGIRYDPVMDGHAHFFCRKCGRIIDFPPIEGLPIPKSRECKIEGCSVKFFGLCTDCDVSN